MPDRLEKIDINKETMKNAQAQKLLIQLINALMIIGSFAQARRLDKALGWYRHCSKSDVITISQEDYFKLSKNLQKLLQKKLTKKQ